MRRPTHRVVGRNSPGYVQLHKIKIRSRRGYATERGLKVTALVPEFGWFPERAAIERRDSELVALADAAVIVWEERNSDVLRLLEVVKVKGIPVHVICGEKPAKVKPTAPPEPETRRELPN